MIGNHRTGDLANEHPGLHLAPESRGHHRRNVDSKEVRHAAILPQEDTMKIKLNDPLDFYKHVKTVMLARTQYQDEAFEGADLQGLEPEVPEMAVLIHRSRARHIYYDEHCQRVGIATGTGEVIWSNAYSRDAFIQFRDEVAYLVQSGRINRAIWALQQAVSGADVQKETVEWLTGLIDGKKVLTS